MYFLRHYSVYSQTRSTGSIETVRTLRTKWNINDVCDWFASSSETPIKMKAIISAADVDARSLVEKSRHTQQGGWLILHVLPQTS